MRLSGTKATAIHQYRGLGNQLWDLAGNRPSLDLRFADDKSLVDATTGTNLVDFTRASSGTYVGSDGLIKTATTNLLLRSEEFDQTPFVPTFSAVITANQAAAPNGTNTADQIEISSTNRFSGVRQNFTFLPNTAYTFSIWARAVSGTAGFSLKIYDGVADTFSANLTATESWQRFSLTLTTAAGAGAGNFQVANQSSPLVTQNIYLWGAQLEQSSTVGEYVKTTSTINSAPRFDHDPTTGESLGLLVEESRTNYLIGSESFAGWTVSGQGVTQSTASSIVAPNGQSGAVQLFTEDLTTGVHRIFIAPSTGQLTHAHSIFVKAAAGTREVYLSSDGPTGTRQNIVFDLQTGSFVSSTGDWSNPFITPYPNGWYRIGGTITDNGSSTLFIIGLNNEAVSYPGDGTSGIYIWGAQLEEGSFPTSYIPTEGTTVTRAADVASISGSNFSSWYRQDEGTAYSECRCNDTLSTNLPRCFALSDGTSLNRTLLYSIVSDLSARALITTNGVTQAAFLESSLWTVGTTFKSSLAYKTNDACASFNGSVEAVDTSCVMPALSQAVIGATETGSGAYLNGTIRRLTYWPTRLPNETLQTITN